MSLSVLPGGTFESYATGAPAGITGTISVSLISGETVLIDEQTTGIVEEAPGSYRATIVVPDPAPAGLYHVYWDPQDGSDPVQDSEAVWISGTGAGGPGEPPDVTLPTRVLVKGTSERVLTIKRGDTWPPARARLEQLVEGEYGALDLTGAQAIRLILRSRTRLVTTDPIAILDSAEADVQYGWGEDDLAVAGEYDGEFEIDWGDGLMQTVPNGDYFKVKVVEDLGGEVPS